MWSYMFKSLSLYYQLYKVTSQDSLVTALIEQDHLLYWSSFMDKYFSGNVFKFLIFFNLLTFNKRVLNLSGSREKWITPGLCCDWLFTADVTHSCAHAPLTQDQAWVDRESWRSASWYQQSQIGVVWFCHLKTYPIMVQAPDITVLITCINAFWSSCERIRQIHEFSLTYNWIEQ